MNVIKELMKIKGIHNAVSRSNGALEVYSFNDVKDKVMRFLSMKSLLECFIRIDFIRLEVLK